MPGEEKEFAIIKNSIIITYSVRVIPIGGEFVILLSCVAGHSPN